ncbi:MAG: serine/threonine-protein phosphatase [Candidatus Omnitrophica bacterium]|nr:serine/threonine-protein phosphatase [Candidatus Omnitrophota bacterium]
MLKALFENIFTPLKRIPHQYMGEFMENGMLFIKSRVHLFCALSVGIYVMVSLMGLIMAPSDFRPEEVPLMGFLVMGGILILYFNKKAKTIHIAKLNAYFFTALLLLLVTKVCIIYYEYARESAAIYLFMLFLVSFTISWIPAEVILITLMHIGAFTLYYLYIQRFALPEISADFNLQALADGTILLFMGFIICMAIRRKDTARDIDNFLLYKEIERKNAQMERELELATRIHKTLIPKSISTDLVDVSVLYLPMYYIGGDYAKFRFIDKDKLLFIICDVTGHGVSAALLVNRLHTEFEMLAKEGKEPGALLRELNDFIVNDFAGTNMYLSAFCCMLDFKDMRFIYSNHGHPSQYIYRVNMSAIERLGSQASLLGIFPEKEEAQQKGIDFSKGDRILLFTDGIIETKDKSGQEYGRDRLEDFIKNNYSFDVDLFNNRLLEELNSFKAGDFKDDIFILNIRVK